MVLARSLAQTAKDSELPEVPLMLEAVKSRGFKVDIAVLDRGYDSDVIYEQVEPSQAATARPSNGSIWSRTQGNARQRFG